MLLKSWKPRVRSDASKLEREGTARARVKSNQTTIPALVLGAAQALTVLLTLRVLHEKIERRDGITPACGVMPSP